MTPRKLNQGGLPLVLSQTFRAIIHSRMKVGMEKYRKQYPHADVVLFEPDREDADMFFASIFSYCAAQAPVRSGVRQDPAEHLGARSRRSSRCSRATGSPSAASASTTQSRKVTDAITDPRPLHTHRDDHDVRQTTRDLTHTLDQLQRWLAGAT